MSETNPIALTRALIRCPSVTPLDAGALDVLQRALEDLGFRCHRLPFGEGEDRIDNLYARIGTAAPHFAFAGHTDVVPAGDGAAWSVDPFAAELREGQIWGRGAADMKGAIASFVAAAAGFLAGHAGGLPGSISLIITGDEEGVAVNGTVKMLEWMVAQGERPDACLVGEPTNPQRLGEMVKIGRRGSLSGRITVRGVQGHTAYPQLADNPVHRLVAMLAAVAGEIDEGSERFQPSNLQITSVDVGNPAANVIPGQATARFNLRFNDRHTAAGLIDWMRGRFDEAGGAGAYDLAIDSSSEAFLTEPGPLVEAMVAAIEDEIGQTPELSTTGGTSDARFIKDICPVAEFGLVGRTMHKADERTAVADIETLTRIYRGILDRFFGAA